MKILIAPDKFKGSLSAREVAENIAAGLRDVLPDAKIDMVPMADGGEGTAEVIGDALGGSWVNCAAHDPLGTLDHGLWLFRGIAQFLFRLTALEHGMPPAGGIGIAVCRGAAPKAQRYSRPALAATAVATLAALAVPAVGAPAQL